MLRHLFNLSLILAFYCVLPTQVQAAQRSDQVTLVHRDGSAIFYDGDLTQEANQQVFELYDSNIERVVINSPGGDVDLGMELGEWIFDHHLDIEIGELCFSSCANYVFPAGQLKILNPDSILGWHGGTLQDYGALTGRLKKTLEELREQEANYFRKINVSQAVTVYGQLSRFQRQQKRRCAGWTYTIDAMARFGITHVAFRGDEWKPVDSINRRCIFVIDLDDIR